MDIHPEERINWTDRWKCGAPGGRAAGVMPLAVTAALPWHSFLA